MQPSIVALALLSLSRAIAQPHKEHLHQHQRLHEKRDVVWTTTWEVVTETLSITTTIWVDGDATSIPTASSLSSSQSPAEFHESPTKSTAPTTSASVAPSTHLAPSTS